MIKKLGFSLLITLIVLMGCSQPETKDEPIMSPRDNELTTDYPENKRVMVVGYLPRYKGNTLDWLKKTDLNKLTHIVIAFFNPDGDGNIFFDGSSQDLTDTISYCKEKNVKVLMSIAGGGIPKVSEPYYKAMLTGANSSTRTDFTSKLSSFMTRYNFDGIDVDIEGNLMTSSTYTNGYGDFISKLRTDLTSKGKLLTAALGSWNHGNYPNSALQLFDYIFLMTYDERGPWSWDDGNNNSGPIASQTFMQNLLSIYENKGIPKSKLFIGLPFYAYEFNTKTDGTHKTESLSIHEVIKKYWKDNDSVAFDDRTGNAHYNGIDTISSKTRYAINNGYAGVMIWEITHDAMDDIKKYSLLSAIHRNNY